MALTNEELRSDIAALTERIRQIRIEQGLPPEPKRVEPFVSVPLSIALFERLAPFTRIVVKYAAVLSSGTIHRLDTSKFAEYREYADLLAFSSGFWCKTNSLGVFAALRMMDVVNESADEDVHIPDVLFRLHFAIGFLRHDVKMDAYDYASRFPHEEREGAYEEIKRYKTDEETFKAALEEARQQRKLIGEDAEAYEE